MKKRRVIIPIIRVPFADYKKLRSGESHTCKVPLNKEILKYLPGAYESVTGTMLVFPKAQCPKRFAFKPKWRFWIKPVVREIVNIIALKEEDMSETIRFTLK